MSYSRMSDESSSRRSTRLTLGVRGILLGVLTSTLLAGVFAFSAPSFSEPEAHPNLVENPGFETHVGTYGVQCTGSLPCAPNDPVPATDWGIHDATNGGGQLWAETDLTRSTAPHGQHWMLHVTGTDAGVLQTGSYGTTNDWSVWVLPIIGNVVACVAPIGHPAGEPLSCTTSTSHGSWQQIGGAYTGGNTVATEITIDGAEVGAEPYTDFYVDNASITAA